MFRKLCYEQRDTTYEFDNKLWQKTCHMNVADRPGGERQF